jgi:Skp family chaperone for outer membrane proteins
MGATTQVSAQQQTVVVTVGVFDAEQILKDSKAGQSLMAQAEKTQEQIKSDIYKQQKQFQEAVNTFMLQQGMLSAADLKKRKEELQHQGDQQAKALRDRQRNLEQSVADGRGQILQVMVGIVKDIAKARRLTFVLARRAAPYFDPSSDISQEVEQKLNAKLPSLHLQQSSDAN